MLRNQLQAYRDIKDALNKTKAEISTRQKDIHREFVPVITLNMLRAYQYCTEERGTESYKRMKAHMDTHVDSTKQRMFAKSTDNIKRRIALMLKDAHDQVEASLDEIFVSMRRDYTQLVTGIASNAERLSRDQRMMRKDVLDLVNGAKLRFERVVGLACPSPEPEVSLAAEMDGGTNGTSEASRTEPKPEPKAETPLTAISAEQPQSTFEEEIAMSPASDGNYAPADDEGGMASTEASKNDTDPASNQFLNGAGNTMTLFEDTDDLSPANLPDASDIFTASTRTGSTGSAHPLYTPSSAAHTKSSKSILGQEMAKQSMPAMAKRQPSSNDSEKENVS